MELGHEKVIDENTWIPTQKPEKFLVFLARMVMDVFNKEFFMKILWDLIQLTLSSRIFSMLLTPMEVEQLNFLGSYVCWRKDKSVDSKEELKGSFKVLPKDQNGLVSALSCTWNNHFG